MFQATILYRNDTFLVYTKVRKTTMFLTKLVLSFLKFLLMFFKFVLTNRAIHQDEFYRFLASENNSSLEFDVIVVTPL